MQPRPCLTRRTFFHCGRSSSPIRESSQSSTDVPHSTRMRALPRSPTLIQIVRVPPRSPLCLRISGHRRRLRRSKRPVRARLIFRHFIVTSLLGEGSAPAGPVPPETPYPSLSSRFSSWFSAPSLVCPSFAPLP